MTINKSRFAARLLAILRFPFRIWWFKQAGNPATKLTFCPSSYIDCIECNGFHVPHLPIKDCKVLDDGGEITAEAIYITESEQG